MSSKKYSLNFTTGGLFLSESSVFVDLYLELSDWKKVRKKVMDDNLLQVRTVSSSQKISGQICARLKNLTSKQLAYFPQASEQEKGYLMWLAVCRTYLFIREFAVEVLRENFINLRPEISYEDFDIFFNARAQWDDNLDKIKPATRLKLRQVLFRMMREAQLITDQRQILPVVLSSSLASLLFEDNAQDLYVFPVMESDLKG